MESSAEAITPSSSAGPSYPTRSCSEVVLTRAAVSAISRRGCRTLEATHTDMREASAITTSDADPSASARLLRTFSVSSVAIADWNTPMRSSSAPMMGTLRTRNVMFSFVTWESFISAVIGEAAAGLSAMVSRAIDEFERTLPFSNTARSITLRPPLDSERASR